MRVKKIVPECFGDKYQGFILVKRMTNDELEKAREDLGLIDFDAKKDRTVKENYDFMRRVWDMAKPYLQSAEVLRVEDGEMLNLEDMDYETELQALRAEIATSFLRGWAMGNGNEQ